MGQNTSSGKSEKNQTVNEKQAMKQPDNEQDDYGFWLLVALGLIAYKVGGRYQVWRASRTTNSGGFHNQSAGGFHNQSAGGFHNQSASGFHNQSGGGFHTPYGDGTYSYSYTAPDGSRSYSYSYTTPGGSHNQSAGGNQKQSAGGSRKESAGGSHKESAAGGFKSPMTKKEAALILGIGENEVQAKVKEAHRRLIVKNHPDAGGTDYLATKINEAKDILMK